MPATSGFVSPFSTSTSPDLERRPGPPPARPAAWPPTPPSASCTSASASRCSSREQGLFDASDRDAHDDDPRDAARARPVAAGGPRGRCGSTRSTSPGSGRATGWPCCRAVPHSTASAGRWSGSPSARPRSAAGSAMLAQSSWPTSRFFERARLARRSASRPTTSAAAPADGDRARDRACRSGRLTRSRLRSRTVRLGSPTAQPHLAGVVEVAIGVAAPAPGPGTAGRQSPTRSGGAHSRKAKRGSSTSQSASGTPAGRGSASRSTRPPSRPCSSSMASEPTSPAMLTSLAATARPSSATAASSRTSPATRPPRSSKEGKNGKSARIVPSRQQPTSEDLPGGGGAGRQHAVGPAEAERRQRRRPVADGEVAADDRDVVELRAVAQPLAAPRGPPPRGRRPCRRSPSAGRPWRPGR